ncbi:hypothetical protein K435DRAFT_420159, partial [Dendrothele bispora CBS 962.96]
ISPQALSEAIASGTVLQDQGPVKTIKVVFGEKNAVVRYGPHVHLGEVHAMNFIDCHAPPHSIPLVPILGVYKSDSSIDFDQPCLYIVTEWIENSQTLETAWTTLEETEKDDITTQLQSVLSTLRSLPASPQPPYIGSVGHLPCVDPLLQGVGPFDSLHGFSEAYTDVARPCFRGHYISIIERLLKKFETYRIVLTHGDLAMSNILVRKDAARQRWEIVALIDWENSGWYPEHWEYVKLLASVRWKSDWALRAQSLLERQYDEDFLLDSRLRFYHRL